MRSIRCEGHTDFGFNPTSEQKLSVQRAEAVCGLVHALHPRVLTTSVGFGGTDPAVIGAESVDRGDNRRVVIVVTGSVTAPQAPGLSAASPGDGSATITFTAPVSDGGSPVSGYQVSLDSGRTWHAITVHGSSPFTVQLTGLTNGTTYPVTVRAINSDGRGMASNTRRVTPSTSAVAASAPTLTSAVGGDTTATITFTAPVSDGGSPVSGYQVSLDSGRTWHAITVHGSSPFTVQLTGLTNGTTYPVAVRAITGAGAGAASDVRPVTPRASTPVTAVPAAPTLDTAIPGDASAAITFTAPGSSGSSPVTSYQYSTDGGSTWTTISPAPSGSGPYTTTITGLTNGTTYPVTVRAVNAVGPGGPSNILDVTPAAAAPPPPPPVTSNVPSAPGSLTGTPNYADEVDHTADADLSFTTPSSTGGSAITGYDISIDGAAFTTLVPLNVGNPNTTEQTYLFNYCGSQPHTFAVRADNANGPGASSNTITVTFASTDACSVATAPTLNTATAGNASATINFAAPSSTGGTPVTGYQYSTNGGTTWTTITPTPSGSSPYTATITGLTNGTTYPVTVRAVNAVGDSVASNSISVTPSSGSSTAPTAPVLNGVADGTYPAAVVQFSAPSSDGGSVITGYQLSTDNGSTWIDISPTPSGAGPYTTSFNAADNVTYHVEVRAVNSVGHSVASNEVDYERGS